MTILRSIKRTAAKVLALVLAAAIIVSCFACTHKDPGEKADGLTDEQIESIKQIAEAFFECGVEVDSESALPVTQMEAFVYYLYNDELTADASGFGSVPVDESDARIHSYFGFKPVLRTHKNNSDQDFYYKNNYYYVRVGNSAADEIKLLSAEKADDGRIKASVDLKGEDAAAILNFVFEQVGSDLRVIECTRLDQK
ncbi:MAG: hypothetical protein IIT70_01790 [Clostridia bacterium]|nr:hypothetical protein [Clostridia bacterium]